jgi:ABC-type transport system involved in multi-copper enzyme maturation permease subunit
MAVVPLWMLFLGYLYDQMPLTRMLFPREDLYEFPGIWGTITYSASFFNLMVAVTVVIITCNEISFRTMKQNVIDGLTKQEVILSKFYVIVGIACFTTLYTALIGFIIGVSNSGLSRLTENIHFIPTYFLQTIGYFSFAFFFAVLVKRPALSIIFFILSFLIETIIGIIIDVNVSRVPYQFFPLNSFSSLTPDAFFGKLKAAEMKAKGLQFWVMPAWEHYLLATGYILLFLSIAYYMLKRRDL